MPIAPRQPMGIAGAVLKPRKKPPNRTLVNPQSNGHMARRRPSSARYVRYVPDMDCVVEDRVAVWWFPADFCQSRLGDRDIGSNACTLIVVIMAHRIQAQRITWCGSSDQPLSRHLTVALAESIVDGNEIYEALANDGLLHDVNLTLPEAMSACSHRFHRLIEWRTTFSTSSLRSSLFDSLHSGIMEWESSGRALAKDSNLYVALIADGRSVLLVYQRNTEHVILVDSHGHMARGALVAQVPINGLVFLTEWYSKLCWTCFQSCPEFYEVSFLYYSPIHLSVLHASFDVL